MTPSSHFKYSREQNIEQKNYSIYIVVITVIFTIAGNYVFELIGITNTAMRVLVVMFSTFLFFLVSFFAMITREQNERYRRKKDSDVEIERSYQLISEDNDQDDQKLITLKQIGILLDKENTHVSIFEQFQNDILNADGFEIYNEVEPIKYDIQLFLLVAVTIMNQIVTILPYNYLRSRSNSLIKGNIRKPHTTGRQFVRRYIRLIDDIYNSHPHLEDNLLNLGDAILATKWTTSPRPRVNFSVNEM